MVAGPRHRARGWCRDRAGWTTISMDASTLDTPSGMRTLLTRIRAGWKLWRLSRDPTSGVRYIHGNGSDVVEKALELAVCKQTDEELAEELRPFLRQRGVVLAQVNRELQDGIEVEIPRYIRAARLVEFASERNRSSSR